MHTWHSCTICDIWLLTPGHHTDFLRRWLHRTIPWWPLWIFINVSLCRGFGTTILLLKSNNLLQIVSAPLAFQNGTMLGCRAFLVGHPDWQYSLTWVHSGSCSWAFRYVSRRSAPAGRDGNTISSTNASTSWWVDIFSVLDDGALESVSAVYVCFPATCSTL